MPPPAPRGPVRRGGPPARPAPPPPPAGPDEEDPFLPVEDFESEEQDRFGRQPDPFAPQDDDDQFVSGPAATQRFDRGPAGPPAYEGEGFQRAPAAEDDDPFAMEQPFPPTEPQRPEFYRDPPFLGEQVADQWSDPEMQDEFVVAAGPVGGAGSGGRFSRARRGEPKAAKPPREPRPPRGDGRGLRNINPQRLIIIAALGVVIVVAIVLLVFMGGDDPEEFLTVPTPANPATVAPATPQRTPRPRPSVTAIPGLVDRNCSDFSTQKEAQDFFSESGGPEQDLHGLDPDNNGRACDELAGGGDGGAPTPASGGGAPTPAGGATGTATQAP